MHDFWSLLKTVISPGTFNHMLRSATPVALAAMGGALTEHAGIMNIGTRPTFNGTNRTLETNLLEPVGNLYGQTLIIHFIARLRSEQQFPSAEALANQIKKDKELAEDILGKTEG